MTADIRDIVGSLTGETVTTVLPLHGGDLSDVYRLTLRSGRQVVAKTGGLVAAEARMLRAIRSAGAPAPSVLGQRNNVLVLEALKETSSTDAGWHALGAGLRQLHDVTGTRFGWPEDYAFGTVRIENAETDNWPVFWAERRLLTSVSAVPPGLARRLEHLATRLPELLPRRPPAALLHGDLWTGNALFGPDGTAHLIDPACYFGHAEVDLAMLQLFGTPGPGFFDEYVAPEPGAGDRRAIYQLWPALVHLRLFGSGYLGMVDSRLSAVGV